MNKSYTPTKPKILLARLEPAIQHVTILNILYVQQSNKKSMYTYNTNPYIVFQLKQEKKLFSFCYLDLFLGQDSFRIVGGKHISCFGLCRYDYIHRELFRKISVK